MLLSAVILPPLFGGPAGCQRPAAPLGMVWIPGGPFTMGTNETDAEGRALEFGLTKPWFDDEHPAHTVNLPGFYLDRNEVTNADFAAYVAATGARIPGTWKAATYPGGEANIPVASINWYQANDYCAWAKKRLPTEAEWERAAKGQGQREWPWGDTPDPLLANLEGVEDHFAGTAPVDSFDAGRSPYGLYNMTGNVMEWVNDWYDEHYYKVMPAKNPPGPAIGDEKVIRGGSWHDSFRYAHTYSRFKMFPEYRDVTIGFRCAKSIVPNKNGGNQNVSM